MKVTKAMAVVLFLRPAPALAQADLSGFNLKPLQIEILRNLEKKGTHDEDQILHLAFLFEKANRQDERKTYVPPHTPEQLSAVIEWAQGAAFSSFCSIVNLKFDAEKYNADNPYPALFNFGWQTGKQYLSRDVAWKTFVLMDEFSGVYSRNRDAAELKEHLLQRAEELGFRKYLSELP